MHFIEKETFPLRSVFLCFGYAKREYILCEKADGVKKHSTQNKRVELSQMHIHPSSSWYVSSFVRSMISIYIFRYTFISNILYYVFNISQSIIIVECMVSNKIY